jgi:ankyrin repeat protein
MNLPRLEYPTHIADQLNALAAVVKSRSRANLTDANHVLETIAVDVLNAHGRSPLMEMRCFWDYTILDLSKPDRFRCFNMLVQRGADVRSRDRDGKTVLHWLAQAGDLNALRVVIDKQPDINARPCS